MLCCSTTLRTHNLNYSEAHKIGFSNIIIISLFSKLFIKNKFLTSETLRAVVRICF